jgi:hypothetical protein
MKSVNPYPMPPLRSVVPFFVVGGLVLGCALGLKLYADRTRYIVIETHDKETVYFLKAVLTSVSRFNDPHYAARPDDDDYQERLPGPFSLKTSQGDIEIARNFCLIDSFELIHDNPRKDHDFAKFRITFESGRQVVGRMELAESPEWDVIEGITPDGYQIVPLCRIAKMSRD